MAKIKPESRLRSSMEVLIKNILSYTKSLSDELEQNEHVRCVTLLEFIDGRSFECNPRYNKE